MEHQTIAVHIWKEKKLLSDISIRIQKTKLIFVVSHLHMNELLVVDSSNAIYLTILM